MHEILHVVVFLQYHILDGAFHIAMAVKDQIQHPQREFILVVIHLAFKARMSLELNSSI